MIHWYIKDGSVYGDQWNGMYYTFTNVFIRKIKEIEGGYCVNDMINLDLSEMDRFFSNDFERKKKQLIWIQSKLG